MRIGEFVEQSLQAKTTDALFQLYSSALLDFGIDHVVYASLRAPHGYEGSPLIIYQHSYPTEWVEHYICQGYLDIDPVRARGLVTRHAFTWDDTVATQNLSPSQILVMNEGHEAGLKNGVGIAFHGPMGEASGMGLASSTPNPDIDHFLMDIEIISNHFHTAFSTFLTQKEPKQAKLTERELEILKWCSEGKSNDAIGEILCVSEHEIGMHIHSLMDKLDADCRLTAVTKAFHGGYLAAVW